MAKSSSSSKDSFWITYVLLGEGGKVEVPEWFRLCLLLPLTIPAAGELVLGCGDIYCCWPISPKFTTTCQQIKQALERNQASSKSTQTKSFFLPMFSFWEHWTPTLKTLQYSAACMLCLWMTEMWCMNISSGTFLRYYCGLTLAHYYTQFGL